MCHATQSAAPEAAPAPKAASHRYWYSANVPDIGVRGEQGWCFGADALHAAIDAKRTIMTRNPRAEYLLVNDVHVTHDGACSCIPAEDRRY